MNSEFTIAVHSLILLAYLPEHRASSDTIACNVSTNPARIRKIMGLLREHGLVTTKEGIGGGYLLSCDPAKTTLARIFRAVSCEALQSQWNSGDPQHSCLVAANMHKVMSGIFRDAAACYVQHLEQLTIQSVLDQMICGRLPNQDTGGESVP
ncbi:MAG: transcriptional regulator [Paenibacillus sp.]|jgi:DNA-binding IscR family transcriptional regulator|nr:transcriptional regulator [Paenibacillus sp.]